MIEPVTGSALLIGGLFAAGVVMRSLAHADQRRMQTGVRERGRRRRHAVQFALATAMLAVGYLLLFPA